MVNPHTSIPRSFSELACGLDGRQLEGNSVYRTHTLNWRVAESVFPLTFFRQNAEPFLRHLGCGQLAVVFEDDRRRVSCLQRHLVGTLDDGDAVGDE